MFCLTETQNTFEFWLLSHKKHIEHK